MKPEVKHGYKVSSFLFMVMLILFLSGWAQATPEYHTPAPKVHPTQSATDSMPSANVIIYRPNNQLTRPYKINSNLGKTIKIGRNEVVKMNANAKLFQGSISAFGHTRGYFAHELSPNKVHYFRLQDRNNYDWFFPYLEVIEVTEEMFRIETLGNISR